MSVGILVIPFKVHFD